MHFILDLDNQQEFPWSKLLSTARCWAAVQVEQLGGNARLSLLWSCMCFGPSNVHLLTEPLLPFATAHCILQKTGYRALHLAALKGSQPVVQVLLLRGAHVDARAKVSYG